MEFDHRISLAALQKGKFYLLDYWVFVHLKGLYDKGVIFDWKKNTRTLSGWTGIEASVLIRHIKRLLRQGLAEEYKGKLILRSRGTFARFHQVSDPKWFDSRFSDKDFTNSRRMVKQFAYEKISFPDFQKLCLWVYSQQKTLKTGLRFLSEHFPNTITELKPGVSATSCSLTESEGKALKKRMGDGEYESAFLHLQDIKRHAGLASIQQASKMIKDLKIDKVARFSRKPDYRKSKDRFGARSKKCLQLANHHRFNVSGNWYYAFKPCTLVHQIERIKEELIEEGFFSEHKKQKREQAKTFIEEFLEKPVKWINPDKPKKTNQPKRFRTFYRPDPETGELEKIGEVRKIEFSSKAAFILPVFTNRLKDDCVYQEHIYPRKTKKNPNPVAVIVSDFLPCDEHIYGEMCSLTHDSFRQVMKYSWHVKNEKNIFEAFIEDFHENIKQIPGCYKTKTENNMIWNQRMVFDKPVVASTEKKEWVRPTDDEIKAMLAPKEWVPNPLHIEAFFKRCDERIAAIRACPALR